MEEPTERVFEAASICRLCPAACGIRVRLAGDETIEVRGDPDHPLSRGYTCSKGRALPSFHHHPHRLERPLLHGQPVDWDDLLDDLAARVGGLVGEHGPDSVGFYSVMGEAYDRSGGLAKVRFFNLLETRQRYTAATVDVAPAWRAAELVTGYTRDLTPLWEPEASPAVALVIGCNPVVSHGNGGLFLTDPEVRLRTFRRKGGELWVLDPRRTETAALAVHHLAPRPGTDVLVLAWLVRELLDDGADHHELEHHVDA